MAVEKDNVALSDTEAAERPVREQLKKASITGMPERAEDRTMGKEDAHAETEEVKEGTDSSASRASLQRKRSFEEIERDPSEQTATAPSRHHARKRSRDMTAEEDELNDRQRKVSGERARDAADPISDDGEANGAPKPAPTERLKTPELSADKHVEAAAEEVTSPKTKRSRLHPSTVEENGPLSKEHAVSESKAPTTDSTAPTDPSRQRTTSESTAANNTETKLPPTSGFANTSSVSPFSVLAGSKSPSTEFPQTSSSALASSAFGSLSASSTSGFGAIGKSSGGFGAGGGFATGIKSPRGAEDDRETEKAPGAASSTFGGALGQKSAFAVAPSTSSGFGTGASGFGKLGPQTGGFGSGLGGGGFGSLGGGALTSFASGKPSPALASSSKPAKAFGAFVDDDGDANDGPEGDEEDEAGYKSPLPQGEDKQDERFHERELETGEEDEMTDFSCRAKLYNFATVATGKKEWRERGLGILRFNVKKPRHEAGEDEKAKARFLMRADGSHRVLLNTPVKKEIKFGAPAGGPPQGGFMYFMGTIEGKSGLELLQLKMRQQYALELYNRVVDLQKEM